MLTSNSKKLFLLIIYNVMLYCVGFSQTGPAIQWQNTIGGNNSDQLFCIQQTVDGGYILGGVSNSNISGDKTENCQGDYDYWLIKTDQTGNILWQNTIGGNNDDMLFSVQQTNDGGYILGGSSNSNISGDKTENSNGSDDYWIVKTDSVGNIQWQNTIGGNYIDQLFCIRQTTDNGYIMGGDSDSGISGDKTENNIGSDDYWIVKTDSVGNIQWQNTIGGTLVDELNELQQTADGGYIVGGWSNSNISADKIENSCNSSYDYWLVKLNDTGNIVWQNVIGGSSPDYLYSVLQTSDFGYLLGGKSTSGISFDKTENNIGGEDYWVVKTDRAGNIEWQNTIGGSSNDYLYCVRESLNGGYILGGGSNSIISGDKAENNIGAGDYWVVKINFYGGIQWQNTIGGNNSDVLLSLRPTLDGGYILGGHSASNISGDKTENSNGGYDYWIVKLAPDSFTSIFDIKNTPNSIQLYPNPAKDELNIQLNQTNYVNQPITISVYDVFSKLILRKQVTSANCKLSTANFFPSVYFVEVKTGKEIYRSRFVKE